MGCTTGKELPAEEAYGDPSKKNNGGKAGSKRGLPPSPTKPPKSASVDRELEDKPVEARNDDKAAAAAPPAAEHLEESAGQVDDAAPIAATAAATVESTPAAGQEEREVEVEVEDVVQVASADANECAPPVPAKQHLDDEAAEERKPEESWVLVDKTNGEVTANESSPSPENSVALCISEGNEDEQPITPAASVAVNESAPASAVPTAEAAANVNTEEHISVPVSSHIDEQLQQPVNVSSEDAETSASPAVSASRDDVISPSADSSAEHQEHKEEQRLEEAPVSEAASQPAVISSTHEEVPVQDTTIPAATELSAVVSTEIALDKPLDTTDSTPAKPELTIGTTQATGEPVAASIDVPSTSAAKETESHQGQDHIEGVLSEKHEEAAAEPVTIATTVSSEEAQPAITADVTPTSEVTPTVIDVVTTDEDGLSHITASSDGPANFSVNTTEESHTSIVTTEESHTSIVTTDESQPTSEQPTSTPAITATTDEEPPVSTSDATPQPPADTEHPVVAAPVEVTAEADHSEEQVDVAAAPALHSDPQEYHEQQQQVGDVTGEIALSPVDQQPTDDQATVPTTELTDEEVKTVAEKIVHDVIVEAVHIVESSPDGDEKQAAEDDGPVDESTAGLRIQTEYSQDHTEMVIEELKKDHEEHEHGTEAGTEGHAAHDLPHPSESAEGHVTAPSDDTTQPPPTAAAPLEAEHHVADHTDEEKALAAVKIQAGLRGMRDRKYVKALKTQDHVIESHLTPPPEQATASDVNEQSLPAASSSDVTEQAPAPPSSDVTEQAPAPPSSDVTEQAPAPPNSDVTEQAPAPPSSDVTDETPLPPPSTDAAPANAEAATSSDTASTSDAQ